MLRGTRGYESRETRVIFIIPETEFIFPFLFSISFQTYDSHDRSRLRINGRVRSFPWTILCKFHAIPDTLRVKLKIDLETTGNE